MLLLFVFCVIFDFVVGGGGGSGDLIIVVDFVIIAISGAFSIIVLSQNIKSFF